MLKSAALQIIAVAVFLAGAMLPVTGTLPAVSVRIEFLGELLPDAVLQLSRLLGSVIGLALLILAHGLRRHLPGAWFLTLWLLGAGIVVSLLNGVG